MAISLHPYKKELLELFQKEKVRIISSIPFIKDIHHIGSSAILGLSGKNIIDIVIGLDRYNHLEDLSKEFEKLGYITKWIDYEKEWTYLSSRHNATEGDFHIHILKQGSDDYENLFLFRDYLMNHSDEKERYEKLKYVWLQKSEGVARTYAELKTKYIKSILQKANGRKIKVNVQTIPTR